MFSRRAATPIDLLASVTALVLLIGTAVLMLSEMKPEALRIKCSKNLRKLAQAQHEYLYDNSSFPKVGPIRKASNGAMVLFDKKHRTKSPSASSSPSPTVDLWALLRHNYTLGDGSLSAKVFICPATKDEPDAVKDPLAYYDFASSKNLSYGYQYQHQADPMVLATMNSLIDASVFPLMADANPYIKGGVKAEVLKDRQSQYRGNSLNHSKKRRPGQNVLFYDGHVDFKDSPAVGFRLKALKQLRTAGEPFGRDNCYTVFAGEDELLCDPGAAPTPTKCKLGSKSDACLVP